MSVDDYCAKEEDRDGEAEGIGESPVDRRNLRNTK